MLKIWEQLLEQNRELFFDCGPFCMNGGSEEGKMTCRKSILLLKTGKSVERGLLVPLGDKENLFAEILLDFFKW